MDEMRGPAASAGVQATLSVGGETISLTGGELLQGSGAAAEGVQLPDLDGDGWEEGATERYRNAQRGDKVFAYALREGEGVTLYVAWECDGRMSAEVVDGSITDYLATWAYSDWGLLPAEWLAQWDLDGLEALTVARPDDPGVLGRPVV